MQRFLIIQTAFIGDVVLATALIEKLKNFFPDAHIDFLLRKGNESLLTDHPKLNEVLIWDKKKNKQKNLFALLKTIRVKKYNKVINVQRFFATGLLTALSGADETIGFDKNPLSFLFSKKINHQVGGPVVAHEIDRNMELVKNFTNDTVFKPRLYPSPADYNSVNDLSLKNFITISPASVWFTKQFPEQQWISLVNTLPSDLQIYLLGGAGDAALCEAICNGSSRPDIKMLAGKMSFLQSAALMSYAKMNYVNDSAPMHFCSAMNAPVTAVYCSTIPGFGFGPLSDIRFIVQKKEPLYCRPCGLHGHAACPQSHFKCAKDILTTQLTDTLSRPVHPEKI